MLWKKLGITNQVEGCGIREKYVFRWLGCSYCWMLV